LPGVKWLGMNRMAVVTAAPYLIPKDLDVNIGKQKSKE
jgi:hypothetical protein